MRVNLIPISRQQLLTRTFFNWGNSTISEDEVFLKSIFAAASQQFVKSVGHRTLKPVPSIDDKDNIRPYQLVVKATKRRFIFFEKAFYYPTEFKVNTHHFSKVQYSSFPLDALMWVHQYVTSVEL